MSPTFSQTELVPCKNPAIDGERVNCDGIGHKANNLFLLFGNRISINEASASDLKLIPKMRKDVATAIVITRESLGRFSSYDQLSEVNGVGPKTLEKIRLYTFID